MNDTTAPQGQPPIDEQQEEAARQMIAGMMEIAALYIPAEHLGTEEQTSSLFGIMSNELLSQEQLGRVVEDVVSADKRASHPFVGFAITRPPLPDGTPQDPIEICIPKSLLPELGLKRLDDRLLLTVAAFYGFLTFPPLRALVRAHGWQMQFRQSKKPFVTARPKIVEPDKKLIV